MKQDASYTIRNKISTLEAWTERRKIEHLVTRFISCSAQVIRSCRRTKGPGSRMQATDKTSNASLGGRLLVGALLPRGATGPQTKPQNGHQHGVAGPDLGRTTGKAWRVPTKLRKELTRKTKQTNLNTTKQQRGFVSTLPERTSVRPLSASCEVV